MISAPTTIKWPMGNVVHQVLGNLNYVKSCSDKTANGIAFFRFFHCDNDRSCIAFVCLFAKAKQTKKDRSTLDLQSQPM